MTLSLQRSANLTVPALCVTDSPRRIGFFLSAVPDAQQVGFVIQKKCRAVQAEIIPAAVLALLHQRLLERFPWLTRLLDCIKQLAVVAVCAVRVRRIDRVQRVGFGVVPDGQVPDLVAGLRQVFTGFLCAPVKAIFRCAGANLVALILIPCISSIDVSHPPRSILHSLHAGRQNAVFLHRIMQHDLGLCPVYTVL